MNGAHLHFTVYHIKLVTASVLVKDPPQIDFQRRVCDLKDPAFELAEAFAFGDRIGMLEIGFQKSDPGNFVASLQAWI